MICTRRKDRQQLSLPAWLLQIIELSFPANLEKIFDSQDNCLREHHASARRSEQLDGAQSR